MEDVKGNPRLCLIRTVGLWSRAVRRSKRALIGTRFSPSRRLCSSNHLPSVHSSSSAAKNLRTTPSCSDQGIGLLRSTTAMPGKKKKHGSRPEIHAQKSILGDIEAARKQNLAAISSSESVDKEQAEDGLDVADQLMATLEARDRAAVNVDLAERKESLLQVPDAHHPRKTTSDQSTTSGQGHSGDSGTSPRRSTAELLLHAGEKIFKGGHSKSPPPLASSPDQSQTSNGLASDMQRKASIRERLFGSSPSKEDDSATSGGARKVSRQQARKVSYLLQSR